MWVAPLVAAHIKYVINMHMVMQFVYRSIFSNFYFQWAIEDYAFSSDVYIVHIVMQNVKLTFWL